MKALHPYLASGYNREVVYPLLGFSDFLSDVDFKEPEMLRRFISDKENYKKVIEEYEKAKEKDSTPYYMFNVTVQNHGDMTKDIRILTKRFISPTEKAMRLQTVISVL